MPTAASDFMHVLAAGYEKRWTLFSSLWFLVVEAKFFAIPPALRFLWHLAWRNMMTAVYTAHKFVVLSREYISIRWRQHGLPLATQRRVSLMLQTCNKISKCACLRYLCIVKSQCSRCPNPNIPRSLRATWHAGCYCALYVP